MTNEKMSPSCETNTSLIGSGPSSVSAVQIGRWFRDCPIEYGELMAFFNRYCGDECAARPGARRLASAAPLPDGPASAQYVRQVLRRLACLRWKSFEITRISCANSFCVAPRSRASRSSFTFLPSSWTLRTPAPFDSTLLCPYGAALYRHINGTGAAFSGCVPSQVTGTGLSVNRAPRDPAGGITGLGLTAFIPRANNPAKIALIFSSH